MKKILMFALMLCLSGIASPFLRGQTPPDDPDQIPIIIEIKDNHPSGIPKSPSTVNLQAYYDCTSSDIVVSAQNAGASISVCVENLVSGESSQHTISGNGVSYLPISGTPGYWILTFTLQDGTAYFGQFTL